MRVNIFKTLLPFLLAQRGHAHGTKVDSGCALDCSHRLLNSSDTVDWRALCSDQIKQHSLFQCLVLSCTSDSYSDALTSVVTSCFENGAAIAPLHPVQFADPALYARQFITTVVQSPSSYGPEVGGGEKGQLGSPASPSVPLNCEAGTDRILTLSLPGPTSNPSQPSSDALGRPQTQNPNQGSQNGQPQGNPPAGNSGSSNGSPSDASNPTCTGNLNGCNRPSPSGPGNYPDTTQLAGSSSPSPNKGPNASSGNQATQQSPNGQGSDAHSPSPSASDASNSNQSSRPPSSDGQSGAQPNRNPQNFPPSQDTEGTGGSPCPPGQSNSGPGQESSPPTNPNTSNGAPSSPSSQAPSSPDNQFPNSPQGPSKPNPGYGPSDGQSPAGAPSNPANTNGCAGDQANPGSNSPAGSPNRPNNPGSEGCHGTGSPGSPSNNSPGQAPASKPGPDPNGGGVPCPDTGNTNGKGPNNGNSPRPGPDPMAGPDTGDSPEIIVTVHIPVPSGNPEAGPPGNSPSNGGVGPGGASPSPTKGSQSPPSESSGPSSRPGGTTEANPNSPDLPDSGEFPCDNDSSASGPSGPGNGANNGGAGRPASDFTLWPLPTAPPTVPGSAVDSVSNIPPQTDITFEKSGPPSLTVSGAPANGPEITLWPRPTAKAPTAAPANPNGNQETIVLHIPLPGHVVPSDSPAGVKTLDATMTKDPSSGGSVVPELVSAPSYANGNKRGLVARETNEGILIPSQTFFRSDNQTASTTLATYTGAAGRPAASKKFMFAYYGVFAFGFLLRTFNWFG
ncbi:unnamed protein product [Clonostachys rosea]|uniref:Extracellular membrane protein CFEM domain-containing protein n=1 Tax=Bionectria ochroleuca TaxID=29856 RepID=A0ABY6TQQ7_BIOOC|nr:unnamed protein product [Clonostachys rosea]